MDTEARIAKFVSEKLSVGQNGDLSYDQSLLESGAIDSVGIFELVTFLENEFGITIGDEQIVPGNFETVNAIAAFVATQSKDT